MSISQEWTKVIRDARGVFLAIRTSLGSVWAGKSGKRPKPRAVHVATMRGTIIADRRASAELERRKSLAFLNNTRNMVR